MVGVVDVVEIVGDVVKQGGVAVVPLRCVGGGGKVIVEVPYRCGSSLSRELGLLLLGICGTGVICGENFVVFSVEDGYFT